MLALVTALLVSANPSLELARQLVEKLRYEEALVHLKVAVNAQLTTVERRQVLELTALAQAATQSLDETERTYMTLLAEFPDEEVPAGAAPKLRSAFQRAKERVYPKDTLQLVCVVEQRSVKITLVDPWKRVDHLEIYQAAEGGRFERTTLGRAVAQTVELKPTTARVYVEAPGTNARWGTAAEPNVVAGAVVAQVVVPPVIVDTPAPPPATPTRWSAIAATAAAGVLVATAVGLFAGGASTSASAGHASFGSDIRSLDDQAQALGAAGWGSGALAAVLAAVAIWLWTRG